MKTRRRKTTTIKHRKKTTAVHRRASSVADLQRQLDQRTHELAEARKDLADALEQQMATSEILVSLSASMTDTKPVFNAIVRNLLRLFGTSYATVQLLQDGMCHMAALDGELGYEKLAAHYPLALNDSTVVGRAILAEIAVINRLKGTVCEVAASYGLSPELLESLANIPIQAGRSTISGRAASHSCKADLTSALSTVCRSKVERLMTLSTSAVAVCCWSDSRSSLRRRVFSMAITAWSA